MAKIGRKFSGSCFHLRPTGQPPGQRQKKATKIWIRKDVAAAVSAASDGNHSPATLRKASSTSADTYEEGLPG